MKVTSYAVARPAYYDRNSSSSVQTYLDQVSPHGVTTRWTTTVAAGKKLAVEVTVMRNLRLSAAAPVGVQGSELTITSGASLLVMLSNRQTDNTLNVAYVVQNTVNYTLFASESIKAESFDLSTGGVVQYALTLKGTSFDA